MLIEQRNSLRGEITLPGDKSISQRAIMFGSLAKGTTEISGLSMSEDCLNTIDCFRRMQVGIQILSDSRVKISGRGLYGLKASPVMLNAGRSGTTIRLLLGSLVGQRFPSSITRDVSSAKKNMSMVLNPLRQMGAIISGKGDGNICPLNIMPSKLHGITYELSRFETFIKSPILIAGLYSDDRTSVVEAVKSRDHSELMLNYFGANIKVDGLRVSSRKTGELYGQHIQIPGDISIAAYFITAGLIVPNSDITIRNVGVNPTRTGILDVYKSMGAKIELLNKRTVNNEEVSDVTVASSRLKAAVIEGSLIPRLIDEIPVIAIAACMAEGTTVIKDLKGFKIKDSGRIKCLIAELCKMGAVTYETEDGMVIEGGKPLKGTVTDGYNDAAIAMSMAVAGLVADGETMVRKTQILEVAYPDFQSTLNSL